VEKGFILIAFIYELAGSKIKRETFIKINEVALGPREIHNWGSGSKISLFFLPLRAPSNFTNQKRISLKLLSRI